MTRVTEMDIDLLLTLDALLQDRNITHAAARLGISESSARVIEHRTRTWLKQQLAKEGYDL